MVVYLLRLKTASAGIAYAQMAPTVALKTLSATTGPMLYANWSAYKAGLHCTIAHYQPLN